MSDQSAPAAVPPRGRSNPLKAWFLKNKMLVYIGGGAAGLFLLAKRGQSGSGGDPITATVVPVASAADDSGLDTGTGGDGGPFDTTFPIDPSTGGEEGGGTGDEPADPEPPFDPESPPAPATPAASAAAPSSQQQGITLAGHFFAGATSSRMTGSGSNSFGKYMIHLITFPGRTETWWHYTSGKSSGKWTQHGSSGDTSNPSKPATKGGSSAPAPTPTPKAPTPKAPSAPGYYVPIQSYDMNGDVYQWHHYTSGSRKGDKVKLSKLGNVGRLPAGPPAKDGWHKGTLNMGDYERVSGDAVKYEG